MVMLKRKTVETSVPLRRSSTSRQLHIPFSSAAGGKGSRAQCKSFCRSDQRSAVSIAGSSSSNNEDSGNRPEQQPQQTAGSSGSGRRHYRRRNAGASSSAAAAAEAPNENSSPPQDCVTDETAGRRSAFHRRSYSTYRIGKSVSIATSLEANSCSDMGQAVSNRVRGPSELATKSIIKIKQLPLLSHFGSSTNNMNNGTQTKDPGANSGMTPHQIRDQKIFRECRFIPRDTFYKKVLVAPNQERQFFSAPKSIRGPGSRLFYDISGENFRHHQDCNIDLTRDMLRKSCSTYCRPSQFRHVY